jgi:hypothetical protein
MADPRLTKIGFARAIKLCAFAAFYPQKLVEEEQTYKKERKCLQQSSPPEQPRAYRVTRALWGSLALVLCSIAAGYLGGKVLGTVNCMATASMVRGLQITGATILLWATLFVRGWDIQTWGGETPTERVNRWLYRSLHCIGTAIIVASLSLQ